MNYDTVILVMCVTAVGTVACVVNGLRSGQKLVVLVGTVALAVQVFCPPCVFPDGMTARRWMPVDLSYSPNRGVPWVDAGWQAIWLTVTVAATVGACVWLERRYKGKQVDDQQTRSQDSAEGQLPSDQLKM
ncbi:hypothetical protein [Gemmata massiliana]|uniref:hypothetical protein n=1 Tax=Gemmata massiliana TaxID=1210884 RepID=UPI0013A69A04|nr:hypothetical protein [Gemmata massiliana]